LKNNKVSLADNIGFNKRELARIEKEVIKNYSLILTTFNEFCKGYKK
jgi:hypothetical protein